MENGNIVSFADILTRYAMQEIDDVNWTKELALSPARFFRAKSDAVINALPRFSRPPEMRKYLKYEAPSYDDMEYTATEVIVKGTVIPTSYVGYDICSIVMYGVDEAGYTALTPVQSVYDPESGNVTLMEGVPAESVMDFDFYTDGKFVNPLNDVQCHIIGLCVAYEWFSRFSNTWLNMTPKITDKTFSVGSESAQMTANTNKLTSIRHALNDSLLRYEQSLAYENITPRMSMLKMP